MKKYIFLEVLFILLVIVSVCFVIYFDVLFFKYNFKVMSYNIIFLIISFISLILIFKFSKFKKESEDKN